MYSTRVWYWFPLQFITQFCAPIIICNKATYSHCSFPFPKEKKIHTKRTNKKKTQSVNPLNFAQHMVFSFPRAEYSGRETILRVYQVFICDSSYSYSSCVSNKHRNGHCYIFFLPCFQLVKSLSHIIAMFLIHLDAESGHQMESFEKKLSCGRKRAGLVFLAYGRKRTIASEMIAGLWIV